MNKIHPRQDIAVHRSLHKDRLWSSAIGITPPLTLDRLKKAFSRFKRKFSPKPWKKVRSLRDAIEEYERTTIDWDTV